MRKNVIGITVLCLAWLGLIIGCDRNKSTATTEQVIDQAHICETNTWEPQVVAERCSPGQKVVFLPKVYGNEQLPVLFAATNCDLRYSIALTNGGVACIYAPLQKRTTPPQEEKPQAQPQENKQQPQKPKK